MRQMSMRPTLVRAIAADSLVAAPCADAISFRMQGACGPTRRCIPLPPAPTPER
jgi:hypothetical protein